MDQRWLVEQARKGDHEAFSELARAAVVRLDRAARLILRDPELARDAVQDGLIRAWRDLPGLRDPGAFDGWLHRLTVNACLDLARRRRRRPIEVELSPIHRPATADASVDVARRDLVENVLRALEVTTGETRPILETAIGSDIFGGGSATPDGKRLAYALQDARTGDVTVHVIGIDGRGDMVVGHSPRSSFEAWPLRDPQGRRLLIERRDSGASVAHPVIVDLAGGPDVVAGADITSEGAWKQWAPDGSAVLAQRAASGRDLPEELWDATTGEVTPTSWPTSRVGGWQRVAP